MTSFTRTPLKTYYFQNDHHGGTEPFWHLVDEPFDYRRFGYVKPDHPSFPCAKLLTQSIPTVTNPVISIEYDVPE